MTRRHIFLRGMVAGLLLGLIGQAMNWLYSAHPDASELRRLAVIAQAVGSAIGILWLARGIPAEPDVGHTIRSGVGDAGDPPTALHESRAGEASHIRPDHNPSSVPRGRPS